MLMEVLQTLKFAIKKDRQSMSFTDGWRTAKSDMKARGSTNEDLLNQLLTGNSQATTEALLNIFDDAEEVEDDN
jgi:hypothetical protein